MGFRPHSTDFADALEKCRESLGMCNREVDWHQLGILWSWRAKISEVTKSSDVAAFSTVPSPHEDCLAEVFVDDVRGGVLEAEREKKTRLEKFQWCRGMGVWEPVLRKAMDAEGAKVVSLRWIDTDKGDAGLPNYRVSIGRERD